jgi:putative hydrolase of the HAD superfamily
VIVAVVIFDLFETLVTEYDKDWRLAPRPAEMLGVPEQLFEEVWRARRDERMTRSVHFPDVLREVCDRAGVTADELLIDTLYRQRLAAKARPLINVAPDILRTVSELKRAGTRLAVISNCSVEEVAAWNRSPLAPLVELTIWSYEVGTRKPHAEIYLRACAELDVAPGQAAFVGDGGSDELNGARLAGMRAYCARWYRDQWPGREATPWMDEFPQLRTPEELLAVV